MVQHYEQIGFHAKKSGICPVCGKKATRSEHFWQSISPWNQKTSRQIMDEERAKCKAWEEKSTYHKACEPSPWTKRSSTSTPSASQNSEADPPRGGVGSGRG